MNGDEMKCLSQREHHKYALILKQEKIEIAHTRNEKEHGLSEDKREGRVSEGTSFQEFVKWKKTRLKETFL